MNIEDYGFKGKLLEDNNLVARVITTYKDRYEVICNIGKVFARLKKSSFYDNEQAVYPTVGDFVLIEFNELGDSLITKTLDRKSYFKRAKSSDDRDHTRHVQHEQAVAANFDYVCITQSLNDNFNLRRIERYLSLAYESGAIPVVILTKCDLVENREKYIYEVQTVAPGVDVYPISCKTKEGLLKLNKIFTMGSTVVFLGSSGVGKSTLVNTLMGNEVMKTSSIRENDSRGRHTTTNRCLFMLPNGAMVIDTPGMRELGMWDDESGIHKTFDDVRRIIATCKFKDCTHTNEPGCKIREAIENGELQEERFISYLKLENELKFNSNTESYLKDKKNKFKEISKINKMRKR